MNIGNVNGTYVQVVETNNGDMVQSSTLPTQMTDQQISKALEMLESFSVSKEAKEKLTSAQRKDLRKDLSQAKTARADERRKIVLAVLQGLGSIVSIGATVAKIFGG